MNIRNSKIFIKHVQKRARELCPDYPNIQNADAWECLWALTSALEGTQLACDDWSEFCKDLGITPEQFLAWHERKKNEKKETNLPNVSSSANISNS